MRGSAVEKFSYLLFLISCLLLLSSAADATTRIRKDKPCKEMVLYYHQILFDGTNTDNATSAISVNATSFGNPLFKYGQTIIFDSPMTNDQNYSSPPAARAQGMYFYNDKSYFGAWFSFSMVFNSTEYKGSINIMGPDPAVNPRDLSIVGGTGDFFMTRGIVTCTSEVNQNFAYFRIKMDLKLYECY